MTSTAEFSSAATKSQRPGMSTAKWSKSPSWSCERGIVRINTKGSRSLACIFGPDSKTADANRMTVNLFNIELHEGSLGLFDSIDSRHHEALSLTFRFNILCFLTFGLILPCAFWSQTYASHNFVSSATRLRVQDQYRKFQHARRTTKHR